MKIKLFLVSLFLVVSAFADELIVVIDPVWKIIGPIVIGLGEKFPLIVTVVFFMGAFRLIMKPLMSAIRTFVEMTPTKTDDLILEKIESNKAFKVICYFLDWALSLKIIK